MTELAKPFVRVVDIPPGATATEAEALLNAPYSDGYYLYATIGTGRAIFKLYTTPQRAGHGLALVLPRFSENKDGKDEGAREYIRANMGVSARGLSEQLGQHGIKRGKDWVVQQKKALSKVSKLTSQ